MSELDLAAPWEALAFYDLLIFAMTVAKTYRRLDRPAVSHGQLLWELILRDGTYFATRARCAGINFVPRGNLLWVGILEYMPDRHSLIFNLSVMTIVQSANILTFYVSKCLVPHTHTN